MFQQRIVFGFPPNYRELKERFPCGPETIFSWGDIIYRPNKKPISPHIVAHEGIHGQRQLDIGLEAWWRRYIDESAFRFEEELVAHRAEWRAFKASPAGANENAASRMLDTIAKRLSSPLYGTLISFERAKGMLV